jgi:hypothetical protein
MKQFRMTHRFMNTPPEEFDEETAPDWLTSRNSIPGSTMDGRWFWHDHVLTLPVGGSVKTDFRTIIHIANTPDHERKSPASDGLI